MARKYRVHGQTATLWLTKAGITIRPNKIGIPRDRLPEAVELRRAGWSWKMLGDHYHCSHTSARRAILTHYPSDDPAALTPGEDPTTPGDN